MQFSLLLRSPILSQFSKSFIYPSPQLPFFCRRNTMIMKSWEEAEGGRDWPKKRKREKWCSLYQTILCMLSALKKWMAPASRNRDKNVGAIILVLKSVGVRMDSKTLTCEIADCRLSCVCSVLQYSSCFFQVPLFLPFQKIRSDGFSHPSDLSLKVSDNDTSCLVFWAVKPKMMLSSFAFILLSWGFLISDTNYSPVILAIV